MLIVGVLLAGAVLVGGCSSRQVKKMLFPWQKSSREPARNVRYV
jgi:hypothetical protein